jgi:hypothetical protein
VQAGPFDVQGCRRDPSGLAVDAVVHVLAEVPAGRRELPEGGVLGSQVRISRDEVGFRDPDGGFGAALGLGIGRDTRVNG